MKWIKDYELIKFAFQAGDKIRVVEDFLSNDFTPTKLTTGMEGVIKRVDGKGWFTLSIAGHKKLYWIATENHTKVKQITKKDTPTRSIQALVGGYWIHCELTGNVDERGFEVEVKRKDTHKTVWVSLYLIKGMSDAELKQFVHKNQRSAPHEGARFVVGEEVKAEFNGKWYGARIMAQNDNGTYQIAWNAGGTDTIVGTELRKKKGRQCEISERPSKSPRGVKSSGRVTSFTGAYAR